MLSTVLGALLILSPQVRSFSVPGARSIFSLKDGLIAVDLNRGGGNEYAVVDVAGKVVRSGELPSAAYLAGTSEDGLFARETSHSYPLDESEAVWSGAPSLNLFGYDGFYVGPLFPDGLYVKPNGRPGFVIGNADESTSVAVSRIFGRVVTLDSRPIGETMRYTPLAATRYGVDGRRKSSRAIQSRGWGLTRDKSLVFASADAVLAVMQNEGFVAGELPRMTEAKESEGLRYVCRLSLQSGKVQPLFVVSPDPVVEPAVPYRNRLIVLSGGKTVAYLDDYERVYVSSLAPTG